MLALEDHLVGFERYEVYTHTLPNGELMIWDVSTAKAAVARGEIVAEIDMDIAAMRHVVEHNEYDEAIVARANIAQPGIAAPCVWQGQVCYLLIDGSHRCVKAYRAGQAFRVTLLSDRAGDSCLLAGPDAHRVDIATQY